MNHTSTNADLDSKINGIPLVLDAKHGSATFSFVSKQFCAALSVLLLLGPAAEILTKRWRWLLVPGAVVILMVAEGIFLTPDHWWSTLSGASVTYDGQSSSSAAVYRSEDGNILILLQEKSGSSLYLVDPVRRLVGMPSPTRFVFLPGYAYSREAPPVYTLMQSAKIEVDPHVAIEQRAIEFNSFEKGRVRVAW